MKYVRLREAKYPVDNVCLFFIRRKVTAGRSQTKYYVVQVKGESGVIEINHLVKEYGSHRAVDDLSLTVEPGRIYGFLGPNGAGKSTTMNILTGYIGATSGTVTINGHDIFKEPEEARKCIGYLPEIPPVYEDMTVWEYLYFAAELKKVEKSKRVQYVEEAMELTHITDMENRLIRNLSKGYRQRVGLAQAVLGYPEIIILDEPTVGLDPKQIIEIRDLIRRLGEKHTVILSSHILSEVKEICDYIFIISQGKLVASDTTENLLHQVQGAQKIELLTDESSDAFLSVLYEVSGVDDVSVQEQEDMTSRIIVSAKEGVDIRKAVFKKIAAEGLTVMEMHSSGRTLEDIFLELTANSEVKGEIEL